MPLCGIMPLRSKASRMSSRSPTVTKKRQKLSCAVRCSCSKPSADESKIKQKLKSRQINKLLERDKQEYRSTYRVLMMGPGKSGKSTILKQMTPMAPMHEKRLKVKKSIRDAMVVVCNAIEMPNPPVRLGCPENKKHVQFMLDEAVHFSKEEDFNDEFFDKVQNLRKDEGFRRCYERRAEHTFFSSAIFFLNRVSVVRKPDYVPSDQDLNMCRMTEGAIHETKFEIDKVKFHVFEPSPKIDSQRFLHFFNEVTAMIFVVDSSAFDVESRENCDRTGLKDGLELFKRLWNDRWMRKISVILFLNMKDLLEQKVLRGKHRLEDYFPDFLSYRVPADAESSSTLFEDPEVTRAKHFIRGEFLRLSRATGCRRECYSHFTCGLDAGNIHIIVKNDCRDIIQRMHLRQYELL